MLFGRTAVQRLCAFFLTTRSLTSLKRGQLDCYILFAHRGQIRAHPSHVAPWFDLDARDQIVGANGQSRPIPQLRAGNSEPKKLGPKLRKTELIIGSICCERSHISSNGWLDTRSELLLPTTADAVPQLRGVLSLTLLPATACFELQATRAPPLPRSPAVTCQSVVLKGHVQHQDGHKIR